MKMWNFFFLCITIFSCQSQEEKKEASAEITTIPANNIDTINIKNQLPVQPPEKDIAETVVAKYYSARNREFQYPFYKGLGLSILEIKRIPATDSFLIKVNVKGRKWLNPNKDTLTQPFEEIRVIRAYQVNQIWLADSTDN